MHEINFLTKGMKAIMNCGIVNLYIHLHFKYKVGSETWNINIFINLQLKLDQKYNPKCKEVTSTNSLESHVKCWSFENHIIEVLHDFNINLLKHLNLVNEWKIPIVQNARLLVTCSFQIFTFLENLIKFSLFIDCKNDRVGKRHPYKVDEKKLVHLGFGYWRINKLSNMHTQWAYT